MKVKIQQRKVYHKFVEIEIEVNDDELNTYINDESYYTIQDYLIENSQLYDDKLETAMSKVEYMQGKGLYEYDGMNDYEADNEWRYETEGEGGHL